jgi:hypothetical protein
MPQFMLFSTTDVSSGRSGHLQRMIEGLETARNTDPSLDIRLFLLLQKCPSDFDKTGFPAWVTVRSIENQISLSAARNRLTSEVISGNLMADAAIYAFPDDDSWYPPNLLKLVAQAFGEDTNLDFWFCRYSSTPRTLANLKAEKPLLQQVISRASSNTIFFRGTLLQQLRSFDESLGVGATLNGGEDTEYAIRAFYAARKALFTDAPLVGHRDPDPGLRPKYFPGTLKAIAKHRNLSAPGRLAYVRKLAVGAALVAKGQMTASAFINAVRNT